MKIVSVLIAITALVALSFYFGSSVILPTRAAGAADVTLGSGSDVGGDLITAGRNVNVQTEIDGDLAVAGSNVNIAAPIQGYLMAAGSDVNINGAVGNDLWAAGANVNVNAPVADNARVAGGSVTLQPQAIVGRDAYLAGNSVEVHGKLV